MVCISLSLSLYPTPSLSISLSIYLSICLRYNSIDHEHIFSHTPRTDILSNSMSLIPEKVQNTKEVYQQFLEAEEERRKKEEDSKENEGEDEA